MLVWVNLGSAAFCALMSLHCTNSLAPIGAGMCALNIMAAGLNYKKDK